MILVATPTRGEVLATFAYDLIQLLKKSPKASWGISLGSYINNNRTLLVHEAVKQGASHILFIDSDMRFPPDALERLLKHNKDIVASNAKSRTADSWCAFKQGKQVSSEGKKGLEEVETVGFGVVLIKTEVFTSKLRALPPHIFSMPFDNSTGKFVGEDVYFCTIARENGYKIWIDHDLSQEVKHTGTVEL